MLCRIVTFNTVYVTYHNVMSHYDVYQGLRFTATLSRVISDYDIKPWLVIVFGWYMSTQTKM